MYEHRIAHLQELHRAVDKQIDAMEKSGHFSDIEISTLKKKRLQIKDKIAILKHKQVNSAVH